MTPDKTPIYDDGRVQVTPELLGAASRFYPIAAAAVRIRRDPLWFGLAFAGFALAATLIYGDLLRLTELVILWGAAAVFLVIGTKTAILAIDAIGHENTMVVARASRIKAIYAALRTARNGAHGPVAAHEPNRHAEGYE